MYELRAPATPLRRYIEHYWFVAPAPGESLDLRVDVFVDARADLIFNFGAAYTRAVIGAASRRVHRSNLDAQRRHPLRIVQRGDVHLCGVRFQLGGLGPFARAPLSGFTDATPPPAAVLGPDVQALEDELRARNDLDARATLLDAFFLRVLCDDPAQERFERALDHLVAAGGAASVADLAAVATVSARHLDRLFDRYLGISPKVVGRVLRFQSALRALMRDPGCSLAALAVAWGVLRSSALREGLQTLQRRRAARVSRVLSAGRPDGLRAQRCLILTRPPRASRLMLPRRERTTRRGEASR